MAASPEDAALVALQLGRPPRGRWRVAERCASGAPGVIATAPALEDGEPFPTLWWLTCPRLSKAVAALESDGAAAEWAARLAADGALAARMRASDLAYRAVRSAEAVREGLDDDPCGDVGIAGQRDPLGVKCLHAHAAAYLAGLDDPVGEAVISTAGGAECPEGACAVYAGTGDEAAQA